MDDEIDSSKSAVPENSNLEQQKNSNKIENSSVHNSDGVINGNNGAENLRKSKTEGLISETLVHPAVQSSVQIETDSQSEFDTEFSPSYQLSGTVQCRLIRFFLLFLIFDCEN